MPRAEPVAVVPVVTTSAEAEPVAGEPVEAEQAEMRVIQNRDGFERGHTLADKAL